MLPWKSNRVWNSEYSTSPDRFLISNGQNSIEMHESMTPLFLDWWCLFYLDAQRASDSGIPTAAESGQARACFFVKLSRCFNYGHWLQGDIVFSMWDIKFSPEWVIPVSEISRLLQTELFFQSNSFYTLFGKLWETENVVSGFHALSETFERVYINRFRHLAISQKETMDFKTP